MSYNRHVYITAASMSILLALAGLINHGLFEIRQGYTSTNGFFIEAISEADRFWQHGTEAAFTLIPNFLLTGLTVVAISIALIIFSLKYLPSPNGSKFLLLFFCLLTLFGGGIGHLVVWLPTWGFATRIHAPLTRFTNNVSSRWRTLLNALWLPMLVMSSVSWVTVMELGIIGYFPGVSDPNVILTIVFAFLFATTGLLSVAFVGAMARDSYREHY